MLIPTILEKDFEEIVRKVKLVEAEVELVQIDVVDGILVDGATFLDIEKLDTIDTNVDFEVHLMVERPAEYLKNKIEKVKKVSSQVEAKDIESFIAKGKKFGYRVGLSLNIDTPVSSLSPYVGKIDYVQFMTVLSGGQGRDFHREVLEKIKLFSKEFPKIPIQVDGGINKHNLPAVMEAGARDVVVGSAVFSERNDEAKKIKKIAFLGGASWEPGDPIFQGAYETSKLLAENGYQIVNGGGPGVMRASTIGAHDGGGKALAVTYHPNKPKKNYEGKDPENRFDEEILTLDYFDRTKVMLQNSDVHIVYNGSTGTISEFGMTWASSRIHEGNHKPIILYGNFWNDIIKVMKETMHLRPGEDQFLKICTTPQEVLEYVQSLG